jgi:hypothetical protein
MKSTPFVVSLNHRQLKWMNFESSKILQGIEAPEMAAAAAAVKASPTIRLNFDQTADSDRLRDQNTPTMRVSSVHESWRKRTNGGRWRP